MVRLATLEERVRSNPSTVVADRDRLLTAVVSEDESERTRAVDILVELADVDQRSGQLVLDAMLDLLADAEKQACLYIGNALSSIYSTDPESFTGTVPSLANLLTHERDVTRVAAAYTLDEVAKSEPASLGPVVDELAAALGNDDEYTRHNAASAFRRVSKHSPRMLRRAVFELTETLDDENATTRQFASLALKEFSKEFPRLVEPVVQSLGDSLDDAVEATRENCAFVLKELSKVDPECLEPVAGQLAERFSDSNKYVRNYSSYALSELAREKPTAVNRWSDSVARLLDAEGEYTRNYAAFTLRSIAKEDPAELVEAVPRLGNAIGDRNETTRRHVSFTLARISEEEPGALLPFVTDIGAELPESSGKHRRNIAIALENVSREDEEAVSQVDEILLQCLPTPDETTISEADRRILRTLLIVAETSPDQADDIVATIEPFVRAEQELIQEIPIELLERLPTEAVQESEIDISEVQDRPNSAEQLDDRLSELRGTDRTPRSLHRRIELFETARDIPDVAFSSQETIADIVQAEIEYEYPDVAHLTQILSLSEEVVLTGTLLLEDIAREHETLRSRAVSAVFSVLESADERQTRTAAARAIVLSDSVDVTGGGFRPRLEEQFGTGALETDFWLSLAIVDAADSITAVPEEVFGTIERYVRNEIDDIDEGISAFRLFYASIFDDETDIDEHVDEILSPLRYALEKGDKKTRLLAVTWLRKIGTAHLESRSSVVLLLREALSDERNVVALGSVRALGALGEELSEGDVTELGFPSSVRVSICRHAGPISAYSSISPRRWIVRNAVKSWRSREPSGNLDVVEGLVDALDDHRSVTFIDSDSGLQKVSKNAADALVGVLQETPEAADTTVASIVGRLDADDWHTRNRAIDTLGRIGSGHPEYAPLVAGVLTALYPDEEPVVCRHLISALEQVYVEPPDPPDGIPEFFESVLGSDERKAKKNVAAALGRIAEPGTFAPERAMNVFEGMLDANPEAACLGLYELGTNSPTVRHEIVTTLRSALDSVVLAKYPAVALGKLGGEVPEVRQEVIHILDSAVQNARATERRSRRLEKAVPLGVKALCRNVTEAGDEIIAPLETVLEAGYEAGQREVVDTVRTAGEETDLSWEMFRPLLRSAVRVPDNQDINIDAATLMAKHLPLAPEEYELVLDRLEEMVKRTDDLSVGKDRYGRACEAVTELAIGSRDDVSRLIEVLKSGLTSGELVAGSAFVGAHSTNYPCIRALREIGLERPEYCYEVLDALEPAFEKDSTNPKVEVAKATGMVGIKTTHGRQKSVDVLQVQATEAAEPVQAEALRMLKKTFVVKTTTEECRRRIVSVFCDCLSAPAERVQQGALQGLIKVGKIAPELLTDYIDEILLHVHEVEAQHRSTAKTIAFATMTLPDDPVPLAEGSEVVEQMLAEQSLSETRITAGIDALTRTKSKTAIPPREETE